MSDGERTLADVLASTVHCAGVSKPFGEMTSEDVQSHASELRAAVGWGPTARVAPVARAWAELAAQMRQAGATVVGDLDPGVISERAEALWVVSPAGLLGG